MSGGKDDAACFGRVAVVMGGMSSEREISLRSGRAVHAALLRRGVDAHSVDSQGDALSRLQARDFDRAFVVVHGRGGEDGLLQGLLETLGLPYTGSGVLGSALAMDKCRAKQLWNSLALPTPPFVELDSASDWNAVVAHLGLPLIVKPIREGSSYGASKVEAAAELENAWEQARAYDERVMAEAWITGREYTAPLLEGERLPVIGLETPRTFYDFEAKYLADTTNYLCPSGLDVDFEDELIDMSQRAFQALGASGWGRVDLMVDEDGKPWLIEVNTVPGMTDHSLVPMAAQWLGIDFDELTLRILATSLHSGGCVPVVGG